MLVTWRLRLRVSGGGRARVRRHWFRAKGPRRWRDPQASRAHVRRLTPKSIDEWNTTMADTHSMTSWKALLDEHGDFLREAVAMAAARLMQAEITAEIGAARGEVAPEQRSTCRNGYSPAGVGDARGCDRAGDS